MKRRKKRFNLKHLYKLLKTRIDLAEKLEVTLMHHKYKSINTVLAELIVALPERFDYLKVSILTRVTVPDCVDTFL